MFNRTSFLLIIGLLALTLGGCATTTLESVIAKSPATVEAKTAVDTTTVAAATALFPHRRLQGPLSAHLPLGTPKTFFNIINPFL